MEVEKKQNSATNKPGLEVPLLMTKKWLCIYFRLYNPHSQRAYVDQLYRKVLTPEVLAKVGTTQTEIRHVSHRTFNREQTVKLISVLDIR
jgi:hypothetical protein